MAGDSRRRRVEKVSRSFLRQLDRQKVPSETLIDLLARLNAMTKDELKFFQETIGGRG